MSCPLPPDQCGKYKCPTHPNDLIEGEESLCPRGGTCSQDTCLLRHNFVKPCAELQQRGRGSSEERMDRKERTQPKPGNKSGNKPRSADKSGRGPAGARRKGSKPSGDAKPRGQQRKKENDRQPAAEARQVDSPSRRGAPKSNKPGNQKARKNANIKNKNGCTFSRQECHKWECMDHPRSQDDFSQTDSRPCLNGPSCSRADCYYSHNPDNRPTCPLEEDECAKYHCPTHPNNKPRATNKTPCLSGAACYNTTCGFDHGAEPASSAQVKTQADPRQMLNQCIPCGAPALARLRAQVKSPQSFADFLDLSRAINLKVKKDSIYLSGLVTPQLMAQNVDKVSTWIEDNSPKQGQIGPLAQHHSIWYKKGGRSHIQALAARKQVKIDFSGKMNTLFIRGPPEQIDEAQEEIEAMLDDLKSIRCLHFPNVTGLRFSKYVNVMNEVIGEDSECCLYSHQSTVYLIGSSKNPQVAEIVQELRDIEFGAETLPVSPKVIKDLKKSGYARCHELQDRFDIVINLGANSLQVDGAKTKIAEFQACLDSDMQVVNERVDVPRIVNQYLRTTLGVSFIFNFVRDQAGKDVKIAGPARPRKDDSKRRFYILEGSASEEVHRVANEMRSLLASMEESVIHHVIYLKPYEDHILNCRDPQLNTLVNNLGIWQDRGQVLPAKPDPGLLYRHVTGNGQTIELVFGDIVAQRVDVLVNAANSKLRHNGGVAAAIEKKAQIQAACRHRVETEGRVTAGSCWRGGAGNLKTAGAILHAVGPRWLPGCDMDATRAVLEQTMASIFHEANQCEARTMALPLISIRIFNRLGEENETNIMQIIIDSVQKLLQEDTSLQVVRFVELDKERVKKFLAVLVGKLGDTDHSLQKAATVLGEEVDAPTEQPEFHFYWRDTDSSFQLFDSDPSGPAHYSLSEALRDGEPSALLVADSTKYADGQRYQIVFGPNKTGTQYNEITKFTREIKWERNPKYCPPSRTPGGQAETTKAPAPASTVPWTLRCVEQVDLDSAIAGLTEFLRTHTYEEPMEHALLPDKDVMRSLSQKHHVEVDYGTQNSQCVLRGDRDAINAMFRGIMQEMKSGQLSRPKDWTKEEGCVELTLSDAEWQSVVALFQDTLPEATIHKVERVQQMSLYQQFCAQLNYVREKMGGVEPPCMLLFHGTGNTSPEQILSHPNGFTRRYAGPGLWGKGSYFAERSAYSHRYAHHVSETVSQMFLVDVIVGEHVELRSNREMVDAPTKPDGGFYDSVKGRTKQTNVYVTYNDNRQYPRYVITYSVPTEVPVVTSSEVVPDNPDQSCTIC